MLELNWSPVNGGQAGRQLNRQFGRTAQTRLVTPIGDTKYDALQARLDRRFANGIQLGVGYTLSKSTGIAGAPDSDGLSPTVTLESGCADAADEKAMSAVAMLASFMGTSLAAGLLHACGERRTPSMLQFAAEGACRNGRS